MKYECRYCKKSFVRESSLAVHVCEQKKRYQSQTETGVQIGLNAYLLFYEQSQGSARQKTFDDFATSPYYRAFVKFGQYCVSIQAINIPQFTKWLLKNNKKIDFWCRDSVYGEYLSEHLLVENPWDAVKRAIEQSIKWSEKNSTPAHDYLRYGNDNALCFAVSTGRISAWVLYNCKSGQEFLARLNNEQIGLIWSFIDADFWKSKFKDHPEQVDQIKNILAEANW